MKAARGFALRGILFAVVLTLACAYAVSGTPAHALPAVSIHQAVVAAEPIMPFPPPPKSMAADEPIMPFPPPPPGQTASDEPIMPFPPPPSAPPKSMASAEPLMPFPPPPSAPPKAIG